MLQIIKGGRLALAVTAGLFVMLPPVFAAQRGDLLVAPTRLVLDGARGSEVVLNNIGVEPATYRVSLELRRMTADGRLVDVTTPNSAEAAARDMIAYAPRRVTLAPNQPQSIRIGVRAPDSLPDGEYRAHLLFRAIPDAKPAIPASAAPAQGLSIALEPVYGVTIPIIVRRGMLQAEGGIANPRITRYEGRPAIALDLSRSGQRSLYGEIKVLKPGVTEPVVHARGIAVYPEVDQRTVVLPTAEGFTGSLAGPATIRYSERPEDGGRLIAEVQVQLR